MIEITQTNWESVLTENKQLLVDVWASWCGPCRMMTPVLEEISKTYSVGKIDADENQELSNKLNVRALPTLIFFKDGKETHRMVGVQPKNAILAGFTK